MGIIGPFPLTVEEWILLLECDRGYEEGSHPDLTQVLVSLVGKKLIRRSGGAIPFELTNEGQSLVTWLLQAKWTVESRSVYTAARQEEEEV